jgi:3-methyladenine DNA glycosylase/8-oxoguanine DNA glycosylase
VAELPYYDMHRLGVERRRARTISYACSYAHRLEETVSMSLGDAYKRMRALPGVGPWTAGLVAHIALGDPDAVVLGDFHLPHMVSWTLAGEPRGSDERMLELLAPFEGHRGRVMRLVESGGARPPAYGPRQRITSIAAI